MWAESIHMYLQTNLQIRYRHRHLKSTRSLKLEFTSHIHITIRTKTRYHRQWTILIRDVCIVCVFVLWFGYV